MFSIFFVSKIEAVAVGSRNFVSGDTWSCQFNNWQVFNLQYGVVVMSLVIHLSPKKAENWAGQHQFIECLEDFGSLTHTGTLTLKRIKGYVNPRMKIEAEKALKIYIRRVNNIFYKKLYNRGKKALPFIATFETKLDGENPHIHFASGSPEGFSYEEVKRVLIDTKDAIDLFNDRVDIQPFKSSGWLGYITKTGSDSLLLNCCIRGK